MTFEQRSKGSKGENHVAIRGVMSRREEGWVQRPWGRSMPTVAKDQISLGKMSKKHTRRLTQRGACKAPGGSKGECREKDFRVHCRQDREPLEGFLQCLKYHDWPGLVVHAVIPALWEAEAGGS